MSDTPKSDAFEAKHAPKYPTHHAAMAFARELERENAKLRHERDRAEMACVDVRLSGGLLLESALAVASAVAQRAKR